MPIFNIKVEKEIRLAVSDNNKLYNLQMKVVEENKMIEMVLTIMMAGIATIGFIFTVFLIIDMWKEETKLSHQ